MNVRDLCNELKWRLGRFDEAVLTYVHRGAPGDVREITGADVREIGRSFLVLDRASIPYHRVLRVELDGHVLWERRPAEPS